LPVAFCAALVSAGDDATAAVRADWFATMPTTLVSVDAVTAPAGAV